jgi:radical SAM superfamily enzyme YgiQ (UPF0313 family)
MSSVITFIYLGINHQRFYGADYHLGSEYIRAYLASCGISSSRLISGSHLTLDQLAHRAIDSGTPILGFTCYDSNYYLNRLLAEKIKKLAPEATIIFGGPSATFSDRLILESCHAVDICVRGEGEETVRELLSALTSGKDWEEISGISFRREHDIIRTPERPLAGDQEKSSNSLDSFPSPYLMKTIPDTAQRIPGILSSRGCPYPCSYCNFAAMSGGRIRTHSVDRVLAELEAILERMGSLSRKKVDFLDDTFTFYPERIKEICQGIVKRGLNKVGFWCETRADRVDEELLYLMKDAGFVDINFGLESADPLVLNRCRKLRASNGEEDNFAVEREFIKKVEQAVSLSRRIGLNPSVSIILGLPGETRKSAQETLDLVRQMGVKTYFHNHITLYPGTELFQKALDHGMRTEKSPYTLPYYTKPAYDTYTVPLIENSGTVDPMEVIYQEKNIHYLQQTAGIPGVSEDLTILLYRIPRLESADLKWIKKFFSLSMELGWMAPGKIHAGDFAGMVVQNKLPCQHPLLLVPGSSHKDQYVWADYLFKDHYPESYPTFYVIPFSEVNEASNLIKRNKKAIFLYTLTNMQDHTQFIELVKKLTSEGVEALPEPLLEGRFSFLDECRWAPFLCPAYRLSRMVIHQDRRITPCITGCSVGEVGESIDNIKKRVEHYKKEEKKKRGCASCPISETCSRCLFPAPIERDEFCRLQRSIPALSQATTIFSSLRAAYQLRSLPRNLFSSFYPNLPPQTFQAIDRLAKSLQLRNSLSVFRRDRRNQY